MRNLLVLGMSVALLAACQRGGDQTTASADVADTPVAAAAADRPAAAASATQPAPPALPDPDASMHEGYVRTIAQMAYVWGWPMVNQLNRRSTITQAPHPGLMNGVLPVAPRGQIAMLHDYIDPAETFVTCPNQDVVYGLGFFTLDEEPAVIQVPDFGERFWVYALYDARTNQFGQVGKPYASKPGFYLLAGPNWKGDVPDGITAVVRSETELANVIPRVFMDDSEQDRAAIQPLINQIVAYPLSQFDGQMKTINWAKAPNIPSPGPKSDGETQWVVAEKFFDKDQFGKVLEIVPPMPGEEALYAQFRALLAAAEKDPAIQQQLVQVARETEENTIKPFFQWKHNGKPAGNNWNRSVNNAQTGFDYFNRTGTARSNMFDNRPTETQYFYTDIDGQGGALTGSGNYSVTFAAGQEPPVQGFWSMTLYNDKHLFHPNALNRYSLGTKNKNLKRNQDGSLTLYVGAKTPGPDKESNWLPAPAGSFSLYIRAYWGKQGITEGNWQPPAIQRL